MEYLEQFKKLPHELQNAVSSEEKIRVLEEIEKKFGLKLVKLVVRVMVKDIAWQNLENFLAENFKLSPERASELKKELEEKIFDEVLKYLGVEKMEIPPAAAKYAPSGSEIDRNMQAPPAKLMEIEEIVKEIKEKTGLSFEDEILERRFENILKSYLKDIRNEVQTEEALLRSKKIGGMELQSEKAVEILKELKVQSPKSKIEEKVEKIFETKPVFLEEKLVETDRNVPSSVAKYAPVSREIDRNMQAPPAKLMENEEIKKRFEGGTITPVFKKIEKPLEQPKAKEESRIMKHELRIKETGEVPVQIRRPISREKNMEDISIKPRVVGPVEELSQISLIDFQRWGSEKTCQIILDKINLLSEESLFKKSEGISAWQKSPLYKLYLEIGQEALEKKKSLVEIIEERKSQGMPTLEISDFECISELNKKLRF